MLRGFEPHFMHFHSFIYLFYFFALLAQSGERATVNREAAGSKPARSVLFFLVIAQLVERRTVEVHMTLCHKSFPLAGCSNHPREIHRGAVGARASEEVCSIHTGVIFLININRFKYFLCLFIFVDESINYYYLSQSQFHNHSHCPVSELGPVPELVLFF